MRVCGKCGSALKDGRGFCENCGTRLTSAPAGARGGKPRLSGTGIGILLTLAALLALGWGLLDRSPNSEGRVDAAPIKNSAERSVLSVDDYAFVSRDGLDVIVGRARNTSGRRLKRATVSFDLWNDLNEKVGTATDSIRGLEPGETWRFEIVVFNRSATQYRLAGASGD